MSMNEDSPVTLGDFDRQILEALQYRFPISSNPYRDIAATLNVTEESVLQQVKQLYEQGIIRRLGASINSRHVGYVSVLVALKVADSWIEETAVLINSFSGITHNYLREGEYNMWFTLISPDTKEMAEILDSIANQQGVEAMLPLPANRVFKVSVKFPLGKG